MRVSNLKVDNSVHLLRISGTAINISGSYLAEFLSCLFFFKYRCDSSDGLRVRAFSLGSRCPKSVHHMPPTPRRTTPASTSTSSIEPCDDLMEMDFSANKLRNRQLRSRIKHHPRHAPQKSGVHANVDPPITSHGPVTSAFSYPLITDGYMDMSPKSSPKVESFNESRLSSTSDANLSPPRLSKHLLGLTSPANATNFAKQAFVKGSPSSGSNMLEKVLEMESVANARRTAGEEDYSYMDMKPGVCDMPDGSPFQSDEGSTTIPVAIPAATTNASTPLQRKDSFNLYNAMVACRALVAVAAISNPLSPSTPCPANVPHIKQPLLDTNGKQLKKVDAKTAASGEKCSTPDGYIDMTFKGRPKVQVASGNGTADSQPAKMLAKIPDKTPDGYVDMSFKDAHLRKNLVDSNSMSSAKKNKAQQQQPHPLLENKTPPCCSGKENLQVGAVVVEMQQQSPQQPQPQHRQCSKPIAIQQTKNKRLNGGGGGGGGSGFFRRKLSGDETQTSKPNFLPLVQSTFASLGRRKKNGQKKEKVSGGAAAAVTVTESTVNAGATIFPLSPDKANSSMTALGISSSAPSLDSDPNSRCAVSAAGERVRLSCDLETRSLERVDEMVNWDRRGGGEEGDDEDGENGDYIAMTPGVAHKLERNVSEPTCLRRSFSGRGGAEAVEGDDDKASRTSQRCTSVPSIADEGSHGGEGRTSVPEVGNAGVADAKSCANDASKCDAKTISSEVVAVANCVAEDRLCQRMKVDSSQPQVTQNYTDVPKTCTASSTHIPHR